MEEGLDVFIVNPGIILGVGKWNKGSCRLFYNIKNGFKLYTKGINGFVGVNDVAEAMTGLGMSALKNKRFLMVSENLSYQQLFEMMATALRVAFLFDLAEMAHQIICMAESNIYHQLRNA